MCVWAIVAFVSVDVRQRLFSILPLTDGMLFSDGVFLRTGLLVRVGVFGSSSVS